MNILVAHLFFSLIPIGLLYIATNSIQSALSRVREELAERQRTEQDLRLSKERYRILARSLPNSAILLCDHDLRFVLVDGPELARTGYSKEAMEGRTLHEALPVEFAQQVEPYMRAVLSGANLTAEIPYGDQFYTYNYAPLRNDEGEVVYGMILALNVTTRKRAEDERERLIAELELRNAELERFTYTVSHDLKSPLITIRGFLGFLEKDAHDGNFERLHGDIGRINTATEKMRQLLDDLLELSRIGRLGNPPESVPFSSIVREALELVQGRIVERGVAVDVALDLPNVYGDRVRLVEMLQNLIDNAARFMGNQSTPQIAIGARQHNGEQLLYVRDNGIGIDPQHHQRVFGLFDKLDVKSEGTGIGLALVKRIVEIHGGRIWIESAGAGQGTTVYFTLPLPPA